MVERQVHILFVVGPIPISPSIYAVVMELADMSLLESEFWGFDFPLPHQFIGS